MPRRLPRRLHRAGASRSTRPGRVDVGGVSGSITVRSAAGGRMRTDVGSRRGRARPRGRPRGARGLEHDRDRPARGVAPGCELHTRTGRVDAAVGAGHDCVISAHTVSGSIKVRWTAGDGPGAVVFTDIVEFTRYNAERGDDAAVELLEQQSADGARPVAGVRARREGARRRAHDLDSRRGRRGRNLSRDAGAARRPRRVGTIPTRSRSGSARTGDRRAGGATTSSATW